VLKGRAATTGAVATQLGIHPNTLRWYEAAGYLPPVPRTPGGYRQYSPELVRLARVVREIQPLLRIYGPIRFAGFAFLRACREDSGALERLNDLQQLLRAEYRLALDALEALDRFRSGDGMGSPGRPTPGGRLCHIGAAAGQTGLSRDRIINWERNGLCSYPRSSAGYRVFGREETDRLLIIRSCRTAGYSNTAIRRLLHAIDSNTAPLRIDGLKTIADTPASHETDLFPAFPTDTLPATLEELIHLTERLGEILTTTEPAHQDIRKSGHPRKRG
jgi:DNA-binding transcriptional MerR regulator